MAKAKEKDIAEKEDVNSILGKIKNVVSGKEKVTVEDDSQGGEDEPMELTEVVEVTETQAPASEAPKVEAAPAEEEDNFIDILKSIDTALEQQYIQTQAEEAAAAAATAQPSEVIAEQPVAEVSPEAVIEEVNANVAQAVEQNVVEQPLEVKKEFAEDNSQNIMENQESTDMAENKPNILSQEIASKSSKAIQNLLNNIPRPDVDSPAFRSAVTLEDIVTEMMKPMLKEWLDNNLEVIVRDIVEKEIKKIIPRD